MIADTLRRLRPFLERLICILWNLEAKRRIGDER